MDPTDPVWMQTGTSPPADSGGPVGDPGLPEDVEFVDFAETEPDDERDSRDAPVSPRQWLWLVLLPLGFTFLLTALFLAMRGVMELGGMVAIGGPYEIAHPAPNYWWIIPVAIIGCILIVFASMGMFSFRSGMTGFVSLPFSREGVFSQGRGKASLVALFFWPAIFLSLGWNFCEYGFFNPEGLVWGWIVCGVVFVIMGGLPLYLAARKTSWSGLLAATKRNAGSLWPQLMGVAAGIPLGILFFRAVS
jgi:hypothetical protein